MYILSPSPDPVQLFLVLSRWPRGVTASPSPHDCLKQPINCLLLAPRMIRWHDSSTLKDVIHVNNKVLLLVSMTLWDMVMSHLLAQL